MLKISLEYKRPIENIPICQVNFNYDEELDNIESLIMDICDWLAETQIVEFKVLGFGQLEWPVDVRVDLSTVIPQVPDVLIALNASKDVTLDFYEQGIERLLCFHCHSNIVEVRCKDLFGKLVHPAPGIMNLLKLKLMLTEFLKSFIDLSLITCPHITNHEIFRTWQKNISFLIE